MSAQSFTKAVLGYLWDGSDLDGGDIQSLGMEHGVIVRTVFDPAKHTDHLGTGVEPGDEWFVEAPLRSDAELGPGNTPDQDQRP